MALINRPGFPRPWPEGEPTRPGERCVLSDLLVNECACRVHRKPEKEIDGDVPEEELDFR